MMHVWRAQYMISQITVVIVCIHVVAPANESALCNGEQVFLLKEYWACDVVSFMLM